MKINKQKGITMWGIALIAMMIGFFAYLGIKIIPVYMVDMKIKGALDSVASRPETPSSSNAQIRQALDKVFEIEDVRASTVDLKTDLTFEKDGKDRVVRIYYESVTPLFLNISVLVTFDHKKVMGTFGGG